MDRLLTLLEENAKLTAEQLAAMLGETPDAVEQRIADYERRGIIRGYKALIDWARTDRRDVTAIIELKVTPQQDAGFERIAEQVARFDEVESVSLMSGAYDLSIVVNAPTLQDVAMFVARRLSTLNSVVSTATHFVLRRYKEMGVCFADEPHDERGII